MNTQPPPPLPYTHPQSPWASTLPTLITVVALGTVGYLACRQYGLPVLGKHRAHANRTTEEEPAEQRLSLPTQLLDEPSIGRLREEAHSAAGVTQWEAGIKQQDAIADFNSRLPGLEADAKWQSGHSLPNRPNLPNMSSRPSLPNMPSMPRIGGSASMPHMPSTSTPRIGGSASMPSMPSTPSTPRIGGSASMPHMPSNVPH